MRIMFEDENNRAVAKDDEIEIGESTFSRSEGIWIIDHTEVADEYGGQGIAKQLVEKIVENAREKNVKLMATCPYALKLFNSTDKYDDVVKK